MEINNIRIPTGKALTYNGSLQKGVDEGEGYTLTSHQAINAGTYTAIATLTDPENTTWMDGTVEPKKITYKINKLSVDIPRSNTYYYTGSTINYLRASSYYTLSGQTSGISIGTYTAKANLIDTNNTQWSDGTITEKSISWSIIRDTILPGLSCSYSTPNKNSNGSYSVPVTITLSDYESGLKAGTYSVRAILGPQAGATVTSLGNITVNSNGTTSASCTIYLTAQAGGIYTVQAQLNSSVYDVAGNVNNSTSLVTGGKITIPK